MILKETILSAFTERGTLLKWLKNVEAALNNAVLADISLVQVSATQIKLKFTFENGDFVESPVLTLPRGEKGEPGKDGLDGEGIAATIEVGTVTTGAAGSNARVTNVGTEQRAILNFVIPRGDTGASGEQGSAGVGFDDADFISINDGAFNITAGDNGVNIEASFEVAVGEEVLEIPATMYLPLKGSESIVIDVDESGDFIDVHLDADIAAKLGRVLVTPMSAPVSVSLVAVDTSNAQTMLTLGSGLSVSGGVLSASGGGGASGHGLTFSSVSSLNTRAVVNGEYQVINFTTSPLVVNNCSAIGLSANSLGFELTGCALLHYGNNLYLMTGTKSLTIGKDENIFIVLLGDCEFKITSYSPYTTDGDN